MNCEKYIFVTKMKFGPHKDSDSKEFGVKNVVEFM